MIRNRFLPLLVVFILFGVSTSCRDNETCASAITELRKKGCNSKQLSKIMGISETTIKKPEKHIFSEADSILLFSILRTYNETGKLPDNLYNIYNKNKRNQVLEVIENFRQEEIKNNELFINNLCQRIIDLQNENLNNFIDNEINNYKSLRFTWQSKEEINQALSDALPMYVDETKIAKIYNDSCASYFNYISRFRENGVKRYITKATPHSHINTIETDVRGFMPSYQFDNSPSHVTYQILASIDRGQDILFTPINWILELLPNWLMITVLILLLIIFIVSLITGQLHLTILDLILLVISAIVLFWGDPYSEIREEMHNQIQTYYSKKIKDEQICLNTETNTYYDNLIKTLKTTNYRPVHRQSSGMQTNIEKIDSGNDRTNLEKDFAGSNQTGDQSCSDVNCEAENSRRSETTNSQGNR